MSLCYDFEKWTIIPLASVAISLTVGLIMQYTYGLNDSEIAKIPKSKERYGLTFENLSWYNETTSSGNYSCAVNQYNIIVACIGN